MNESPGNKEDKVALSGMDGMVFSLPAYISVSNHFSSYVYGMILKLLC